MIDTTTGSMQLSHKLELTPKHYPGIAHNVSALCFISKYIFFPKAPTPPSGKMTQNAIVPHTHTHTSFFFTSQSVTHE